MSEIKEPDCPGCGRPSNMIMCPEQAFCTYDDCETFCWNMTMTRAELMKNISHVDLSGLRTMSDDGEGEPA